MLITVGIGTSGAYRGRFPNESIFSDMSSASAITASVHGWPPAQQMGCQQKKKKKKNDISLDVSTTDVPFVQ